MTGASSGIGRVFALELARRGHSVLAVARRVDRLEALAQEAKAEGRTIEPLAADLLTPAGVDSVARRAAELPTLDLLVNNAGMATGGDFIQSSMEQELASIHLNVDALVMLTHRLLPVMVERKRGVIINLASVVAFQPFPHFATYAATKAFVLSFSEALAEELRGTPVRVLALCPGSVRSEIEMFAHNAGLIGKLPSLSPEQVVRAGLRAADRGKVVEIVGPVNQALVFMNRLAPRAMIRWFMGASARPPS